MSDDFPRIRKERGVFWIEVDKIKPNPHQPRRDFDEAALAGLAESIRQYGVLQPLVVVRHEKEVPTGSVVEYELIAGERRWRAAQIAGINQVPVIIREEPPERVKLELALIENIQREDLSPLERAEAFDQLVRNFKLRHHEVGKKVGKSREFVSNTIRLLTLPDEIKDGLRQGLISEGHTRPLLSLAKDRDEQINLYKEIIYRKMTVRQAEEASRAIVKKRIVREKEEDPEMINVQRQLSDVLGTKVMVERRGEKKRVSIDFYSEEEFNKFLDKFLTLRREEGREQEQEREQKEREQSVLLGEPSGDNLTEEFTI
jgi:ParB family chromosome partitioning protein